MLVINGIYHDRIFAEIDDDIEKRYKDDFKSYISQWFLQKFGCKGIAEIFLKDFMISLKKYGRLSDRFRVFLECANLEELIDVEEDQNSTNVVGISKIKFRKIYMCTSEALKIVLKIAYLTKLQGSNYFGPSKFLSLFPNIFVKGMDLLQFETAQKIMENLQEEQQVEIQNLEAQFRKMLLSDLSSRGKDQLGVYNEIMEEDED